jgi:hypothetical protein
MTVPSQKNIVHDVLQRFHLNVIFLKEVKSTGFELQNHFCWDELLLEIGMAPSMLQIIAKGSMDVANTLSSYLQNFVWLMDWILKTNVFWSR